MPDANAPAGTQARVPPRDQPPSADLAPVRRLHAVPVLITLMALFLAGIATWAMWQTYMEAPWTRDGTVRAYVVTIAPEVSGRVVQLPVADNQFVHKGDLLIAIDPTDYAIAVDLAQAAADQASANATNAQREAERRAKLNLLETSEEEKQTYQTAAVSAAATSRQAVANLAQARVNLRAGDDPVSGQWLRHQFVGAGGRLRDRPRWHHFTRRCRLVLGGWLLCGDTLLMKSVPEIRQPSN